MSVADIIHSYIAKRLFEHNQWIEFALAEIITIQPYDQLDNICIVSSYGSRWAGIVTVLEVSNE